MRAKKPSRTPKNPNTQKQIQVQQGRKRRTPHREVEGDDDDGWEDLLVGSKKKEEKKENGVVFPVIRTFRIQGLVAFPSVFKATAVAAGVFYAFGSVLLFCAVTLASYMLLVGYSTVTFENEDEMLECATLAHLVRRFRRGTLGLNDCIHYVLYKILRVIESIKALHRSMLDYSFTVSVTHSSAYHDLLELVETKEEQQQTAALGSKPRKTATLTATQKKKMKKLQRMKATVYTGHITIENIVPEIAAATVKKEEEEPIRVMKAVKVSPASLSSKVVSDLKQETTVVLGQLKSEELLPTSVESAERRSVDKKKTKQTTPGEKKQQSVLRVETEETPATGVQAVMQLPLAQAKQQDRVLLLPAGNKPSLEVEIEKQDCEGVRKVATPVVPSPTASSSSCSSDSSTVEKPRRRRHSRRPRRSTATERLSSYEEFLLLEPTIVAKKAASLAPISDKDHKRYVEEAAKVRALQQTVKPFVTKLITNPEIRMMVEEMNSMVSAMHATMAENWDLLASLSVVEEEPHKTPEEEVAAAPPTVACVESAASEAEEGVFLSESEYEDECFGDVEYDDNYYSYHATSTPCV